MNWAEAKRSGGKPHDAVRFPLRGEWAVLLVLGLIAGIVLTIAVSSSGDDKAPPTDTTPVGYVYVLGDAVSRPGAYPFRTDRSLDVREVYLRAGGEFDLLDNLPRLVIVPPQLVFFERETMSTDGPLDINRAPAELLEELPGIGPVLAGRIIAGRPYSSVEELIDVPGIGPVLAAELRGLVFVR